MLNIEKLVKIYEDGTVGVDGLNLTVKAGEVYVMLGANGDHGAVDQLEPLAALCGSYYCSRSCNVYVTFSGVFQNPNPYEAIRSGVIGRSPA